MPSAVRVIDRVADMDDWDQTSFTDGKWVRWDAVQGKFVAATPPDPSTGGSDANYLHTQTVPSTTWIINHNLDKYPAVTIVDSAGSEVEGAVQHVSRNQVVLSFNVAFGGSAFLN